MQEILKKHLLSILCVVSLLALFLPFATVSVNMEIFGYSSGSSESFTGFAAVEEGTFGYALIIGPVVLIAMNYVKQLEKYKSLLAIVVPVVCAIVCVLAIIQAKSLVAGASGGGFDMDVKTSIGIGSILALLSYIGAAIVGGVTYHNLTLDKAGLERLKQEGTQLLQSAQTSLTGTVQNVSASIQEVSSEQKVSGEQTVSAPSQQTATKPVTKNSVNLRRTDEVLAMIEKLSQMKDSGVLTEEEFNEKKRQLLSEI